MSFVRIGSGVSLNRGQYCLVEYLSVSETNQHSWDDVLLINQTVAWSLVPTTGLARYQV